MTCLNPKPSLRDENSLELVINFSARWIKAGVFESFVHDLHAVLRIAEGRKEGPIAAILNIVILMLKNGAEVLA